MPFFPSTLACSACCPEVRGPVPGFLRLPGVQADESECRGLSPLSRLGWRRVAGAGAELRGLGLVTVIAKVCVVVLRGLLFLFHFLSCHLGLHFLDETRRTQAVVEQLVRAKQGRTDTHTHTLTRSVSMGSRAAADTGKIGTQPFPSSQHGTPPPAPPPFFHPSRGRIYVYNPGQASGLLETLTPACHFLAEIARSPRGAERGQLHRGGE